MPVFKEFLHLQNGSLTLVLTSFIVGAIVSMPVTGQLIARYGSRRITRIAAIGYALMIGLLAQASSFLLFLIFAGLLGAANGALDIAMNANAVTIEKHYGRSSMCLFQGCWSAGGLLGASAAGLLLKHQGTALTDLSLIAILLGLGCIVSLPMLVDDVARPSRSKFVWPDSALFRIAILAAFGLLAEGAIADWAAVYLHSNLGVTLPLAAAGYAAYAIAMTVAQVLRRLAYQALQRKKYLAREWPADSHRHNLHPPFFFLVACRCRSGACRSRHRKHCSRCLWHGGSRYSHGIRTRHLSRRYDRLLRPADRATDDWIARSPGWATAGNDRYRGGRNHRRSRTDVLSLGFNITSRQRGKPLITLSCDAILFDMDGTLVDSTGCVKAIWGRWAQKHGIELSYILQHSHGRRTIDTLNQIAPHLDVAAEAEALEAEEITIREGMVAIGGAFQLLSRLKPHQWAVVTSARQAAGDSKT